LKKVSHISLTSDFGIQDWFVGTMKGVIAGINQNARVLDISHDIPAGNIRAGAFALASSYGFFPRGTIHLAIVDPGVGSNRGAIAVKTTKYIFVGPDNGVLSWAAAREKILAIHLLENPKFFLPTVSSTFHGRDVFSPVAAHLSLGIPVEHLGPRCQKLTSIPWPKASSTKNEICGEILYVDRFGNAITNIEHWRFDGPPNRWLREVASGRFVSIVGTHYHAVAAGRPVAVLGSTGFLELAVNAGNAAGELGLREGDKVSVRLKKRH
jgi:S-adenosylmethionine hydrolase